MLTQTAYGSEHPRVGGVLKDGVILSCPPESFKVKKHLCIAPREATNGRVHEEAVSGLTLMNMVVGHIWY